MLIQKQSPGCRTWASGKENALDVEDGVPGVHGRRILGSFPNQALLVGEGNE